MNPEVSEKLKQVQAQLRKFVPPVGLDLDNPQSETLRELFIAVGNLTYAVELLARDVASVTEPPPPTHSDSHS